MSLTIISRAALIFTTLATAAAADVLTVAPSGADLSEVQAAVDAAAAGDLVLVAAGDYAAVTFPAHSLTVTADAGAAVELNGLALPSLAPDATLVLRGLDVLDAEGVALAVADLQGTLVVDDCTLVGADAGPGDPRGFSAVTLAGTGAAHFTACTLEAGRGQNDGGFPGQGGASPGGHALDVGGAPRVALIDCEVLGGKGGGISVSDCLEGALGGDAIRNLHGGDLFLGGCHVEGGGGGSGGWDGGLCFGGSGEDGAAVFLSQGGSSPASRLTLRDTTLKQTGGFPPLVNLIDLPVITHPAPMGRLVASAPTREGDLLQLDVSAGAPGDQVLLLIALDPGHVTVLKFQAPLLLAGVAPPIFDLGVLDGAGALGASATIPELGAGLEGLLVHAQLAFVAPGDVKLGPGAAIALLDAGF